jgi:leucine dehydrogenase
MIDVKEQKKATTVVSSNVFESILDSQHEQVVFCHDPDTGLKAIIAIHNTVLGPALGGTRMWVYKSEAEALNDVLRLSRGMTYKAAISGLNLGGAKAVIIGDASKIKTEALKVLLPVQEFESEATINMFKAGLELGLKKYFDF